MVEAACRKRYLYSYNRHERFSLLQTIEREPVSIYECKLAFEELYAIQSPYYQIISPSIQRREETSCGPAWMLVFTSTITNGKLHVITSHNSNGRELNSKQATTSLQSCSRHHSKPAPSQGISPAKTLITFNHLRTLRARRVTLHRQDNLSAIFSSTSTKACL